MPSAKLSNSEIIGRLEHHIKNYLGAFSDKAAGLGPKYDEMNRRLSHKIHEAQKKVSSLESDLNHCEIEISRLQHEVYMMDYNDPGKHSAEQALLAVQNRRIDLSSVLSKAREEYDYFKGVGYSLNEYVSRYHTLLNKIRYVSDDLQQQNAKDLGHIKTSIEAYENISTPSLGIVEHERQTATFSRKIPISEMTREQQYVSAHKQLHVLEIRKNRYAIIDVDTDVKLLEFSIKKSKLSAVLLHIRPGLGKSLLTSLSSELKHFLAIVKMQEITTWVEDDSTMVSLKCFGFIPPSVMPAGGCELTAKINEI